MAESGGVFVLYDSRKLYENDCFRHNVTKGNIIMEDEVHERIFS